MTSLGEKTFVSSSVVAELDVVIVVVNVGAGVEDSPETHQEKTMEIPPTRVQVQAAFRRAGKRPFVGEASEPVES